MQETQEVWVQSLGWEGSLEEGVATHSSILAWRIPRTEEAGRLQSIGLQSRTQQERLSSSSSSRITGAEGISEQEDRMVEITAEEQNKGRRVKKN